MQNLVHNKRNVTKHSATDRVEIAFLYAKIDNIGDVFFIENNFCKQNVCARGTR